MAFRMLNKVNLGLIFHYRGFCVLNYQCSVWWCLRNLFFCFCFFENILCILSLCDLKYIIFAIGSLRELALFVV